MAGKVELVEAADYLRHLLTNIPRFRNMWTARTRQSSARELCHDAIAQVLVDGAWEAGIDEPSNRRAVKDRVRRALTAEVLTPQTCDWFIEAFGFDETHAEELRERLRPDRPRWTVDLPPPAGCHTLSLQELHWIGPDRRPTRHRTVQTLAAHTDGVDHYLYRCDTADADVRAIEGAELVDVRPDPVVPGFTAYELRFPQPITSGQVRVLEYETTFRYPRTPEPVMRRAFRSPLHSLSLRVTFDPAAHPSRIDWCLWSTLDDPPASAEPVETDSELAVHHFLARPRPAIAGFRWTWDDDLACGSPPGRSDVRGS